ncbi:unnamed protein product [Didymodactylos carnosus]|uniref:Uncharacterized protein n=1 Tax=Didymodactylos carnosus TaxID=1234261 RepID=A0A813SZP4_9BILA|nr:unnamed protein product [Didymodactylos carnosus]CAF0801464.1 unnamed protein product [Didymodactylos carnosus]CAF3506549.1 unnamed protein product [Didymodactylos carnosus]CAF3586488.1 unnamed protein product [Didymodactylos carnosus]
MYFLDNLERFVLYLLCGCFMGLTIILTIITIILYNEKRISTKTMTHDILPNSSPNSFVTQEKNKYEFTTTKDYSKSYIPVYRYNSRALIHNSIVNDDDRKPTLKHFTSNNGYFPTSYT